MNISMERLYSDATIRKGDKLRSNKLAVQVDAEDANVWWVKGSNGTKYRVQQVVIQDTEEETRQEFADLAPELPYLTCSCPNGQNRARPQCYHTAAVMHIILDGTQAEYPVMSDPDPLNEDFLDDDTARSLKDQGFSDDEIAFLRS
ncbi:hypothetical protein HOT31_gp149 [Microbacterium phage Hendrix]|uniref:SWIM-type domain-containing protein n=1 Tax=Microbacterium phage Hendrix TaxID=2182341 RepID=A0A2U8UUM5_9CAUD|nr:hypothetical protein HOT31_gp149 [Microbacterium phage Hendrix]AWN07819.1 hypothetical protein PBI_HENDRIX_148 [Microbacterium phage Hendrix]